MRLACCMFGLLIFFKAVDSNNARNVYMDLYEQGEKDMEESQEEGAHKIPVSSTFIKIKDLTIRSFRYTTHIFEYRYQNPLVDILIPPPK
jgi:hypothetical protein